MIPRPWRPDGDIRHLTPSGKALRKASYIEII
jgi:hypothetical protein